MKIKDFIEQYHNATDKPKFLKKIIFRYHMPYVDKLAAAQSIVKLSTYDEEGNFRINSPQRYLLWVQAILHGYTTLETGDAFITSYDALDQEGLIEEIIAAIGKDAEALQTIISMTLDDLLTNERDLVSYVDHKSETIMQAFDVLAQLEPPSQEE